MSWYDMELDFPSARIKVGEVLAILQWVLNEEQLEEAAEELTAFKRKLD